MDSGLISDTPKLRHIAGYKGSAKTLASVAGRSDDNPIGSRSLTIRLYVRVHRSKLYDQVASISPQPGTRNAVENERPFALQRSHVLIRTSREGHEQEPGTFAHHSLIDSERAGQKVGRQGHAEAQDSACPKVRIGSLAESPVGVQSRPATLAIKWRMYLLQTH